ncbi:MAG: alpha/beta hydrolase family protein [Saprospiraceae bacterium]
MSPVWPGFLFVISTFLQFGCARAAPVDTVEIYSAAMHKSIPCLVVRPKDYSVLGQPYPTLYLLHGWSGDFAGWRKDAPQLPELADRYQMLIVCPDGGYDSWYLDSPVDSTVRYETHVAREVVQYIDHYYHTRPARSGRAIAGLSMGGHGALSIAIRHPEVFGAVGSICGGLDLRPFKKNNWDLQSVLGDPNTQWKNWEDYSVVNLVPQLKNADLQVIIDCGLNDFFIEPNREMHRRLVEARIPHEYTERPGEHNAAYWSSAVDMQAVFFHRFFGRHSTTGH